VSQLHSISCDHCCNTHAMEKSSIGAYLAPEGWIFEEFREYCSRACQEDAAAGVAHPSTPRYDSPTERKYWAKFWPS
jgi:hypothetical protein